MWSKDKNIGIRAAVLLIPVGMMWFIHALDELLPRGVSVAGIGIVPRTIDGLYGIVIAPFIHATWEHLIANTLPLLVLGALVLLRGVAEYFFVALVSIIVGGFGTWLFGAGDTQHVGASGVIFGFFGYLVFRSAFDRRIGSAVITLAVALGYGTAIAWALLPEPDISWSGHFFGFLAGFLAARVRYPHERTSRAAAAETATVVNLSSRRRAG